MAQCWMSLSYGHLGHCKLQRLYTPSTIAACLPQAKTGTACPLMLLTPAHPRPHIDQASRSVMRPGMHGAQVT